MFLEQVGWGVDFRTCGVESQVETVTGFADQLKDQWQYVSRLARRTVAAKITLAGPTCFCIQLKESNVRREDNGSVGAASLPVFSESADEETESLSGGRRAEPPCPAEPSRYTQVN